MENLINIPGRLHSVAIELHVAGANEIYDDNLDKLQDEINSILVTNSITNVQYIDGLLRFYNSKGHIVKVISTPQEQSDYAETDSSKVTFIKNKPTIPTKTSDLTNDSGFITDISGKQDVIQDLDDIRAGALAGATAYQKPQTGIPTTDLASDVQTDIAAIDGIEEVIPAQASSSNQLADKDFVNSSIATATATYRGSYNLVSDLLLSVSATQQQIAGALATKMEALSITPDNNDYCFVQIPTADATPTEIARIDRYKYDGTAWAYEYSLNNSSFTAAQWATINSGITSGLVTKLSDLPTNSELTTLLNGKANTADLAGVATSGSYNDLSNKPTIPAAQVQADWNQTDDEDPSYIKNKPTNIGGLNKEEVMLAYNLGDFARTAHLRADDCQELSGGIFISTNATAANKDNYLYLKSVGGDLIKFTSYYNTEILGLTIPAGKPTVRTPNAVGNYQVYDKIHIPYNGMLFLWAGITGNSSGQYFWIKTSDGSTILYEISGRSMERLYSPVVIYLTAGDYRLCYSAANFIFYSASLVQLKMPVSVMTNDAGYASTYAELPDKPTIPDISNCIQKSSTAGLVKNDGSIDTNTYLTQHQDITGKADKVSGATNGNFAALDSNGNLTDSGHKHSDYLTQHQDLSNYVQKSQTAGLLKNDGTVDTTQYLSQHLDISGKADKSEMSVVPGTGTNADKTTITLKQGTSATVLTTHQDISGKANTADLATVATSGSYNSLSDKPTIPTVPTDVSSFNNDTGYITASDIADKLDEIPIVQVASGTTAINAAVNTYYEVAGEVGALAIALPTPTDLTKVSMVVVHLTAGTTPNVVIGSTETIDYSAAYDISASKEYEINCMYNGDKWVVADMEVV